MRVGAVVNQILRRLILFCHLLCGKVYTCVEVLDRYGAMIVPKRIDFVRISMLFGEHFWVIALDLGQKLIILDTFATNSTGI